MISPRHALIGTATLLVALAVLLMPAAALAANEPNGAAGCMGIEQAAISPPGSSDEEPGGARQFVNEIRDLAVGLGVPAGELFAWVASLHEGSHEDCDAALGGGGDAETTSAVARAFGAASAAVRSPVSTAGAWPKVD